METISRIYFTVSKLKMVWVRHLHYAIKSYYWFLKKGFAYVYKWEERLRILNAEIFVVCLARSK